MYDDYFNQIIQNIYNTWPKGVKHLQEVKFDFAQA